MTIDTEDDTIYAVVVNHEEQYSIWPADKALPSGWREAGKRGLKPECLAFVKEVWTDMRPLSLRREMEEAERNPPAEPLDDLGETEDPEPDDLITRLASGPQEVRAVVHPEDSAAALQAAIERRYVHILFPGTRGGTELGVALEDGGADLSRADFLHACGSVRLAGTLTLNYVPVRCLAEIDVATLRGSGRLERVN